MIIIKDNLEIISPKKFKWLYTPAWVSLLAVFAFLVVSLLLFGFVNQKVLSPPTKIIVQKDTVYITDIELNNEEIAAFLSRNGCILANVAVSQFRLETFNFKSPICFSHKNIAGIKVNNSKYVKGMRDGYCIYKTYKDCLMHYIEIQNRYLKNINGRYAEAPKYVETLRKFK